MYMAVTIFYQRGGDDRGTVCMVKDDGTGFKELG